MDYSKSTRIAKLNGFPTIHCKIPTEPPRVIDVRPKSSKVVTSPLSRPPARQIPDVELRLQPIEKEIKTLRCQIENLTKLLGSCMEALQESSIRQSRTQDEPVAQPPRQPPPRQPPPSPPVADDPLADVSVDSREYVRKFRLLFP